MKKFLLAGAALALLSSAAGAADLPRAMAKAPIAAPYAQSAIFSWTGGYGGIVGGYAWGEAEINPIGAAVLPVKLKPEGGFFGAEIGYNYQFAPNWVAGISGDAFLSDISKGETLASAGGVSLGGTSKLDKFGTIRGKIGYALDRVWVYGTGGLAIGYNEGTLDIATPVGGTRLFDSQTHVGWAAGAGVNWAFMPNVTWSTEYLYVDLGKKTYDFAPGTSGALAFDVHPTYHLVKSGLNFKFSAF